MHWIRNIIFPQFKTSTSNASKTSSGDVYLTGHRGWPGGGAIVAAVGRGLGGQQYVSGGPPSLKHWRVYFIGPASDYFLFKLTAHAGTRIIFVCLSLFHGINPPLPPVIPHAFRCIYARPQHTRSGSIQHFFQNLTQHPGWSAQIHVRARLEFFLNKI